MNISIIIIYASVIYSEISYIHVVSHRLYKSVVFLIAGYLLIFNSGNQDIRSISIPVRLLLVVVPISSNLGLIFMFTMSTEHLFKLLTTPIHILIIPILTLRIFFIVKITMKLLETLCNSKSYVLTNSLSLRFYSLLLPLILCICGNIYLTKVQPIVYFEYKYYNMLIVMIIFVIPINLMHKSEINNLRPIRLDQELNREILLNIIKKTKIMRYNALIL